MADQVGVEPTIFALEVRCLIHLATDLLLRQKNIIATNGGNTKSRT